MTSATPTAPPRPGRESPSLVRGSKYTLLARLAVGGMAEIYAAEASGAAGFAKTLVVKRILPHVAHDREFIALFLDEARTAARINHPNVCQVFDLVEDGGSHLLVMEYLEGATVADLLRLALIDGRPIDPRIAAGIAVQALEGLDAVHELVDEAGRLAGVIHRDVSPGNLFVSTEGAVKLLDFGIAKATWVAHKTKTGMLLGKCDYMSPEQARGNPLDRRSDVFALAVVLHELLTGQRLFRRINDYETLRAVLRDPIVPPSTVAGPTVPASLDAVVLGGLRRDRDSRYPTALAMRLALEAAMAPHGGVAGPRELGELVHARFAGELAERRTLLSEARKQLGAEGAQARPPSARAIFEPAPPSSPDLQASELGATSPFQRVAESLAERIATAPFERADAQGTPPAPLGSLVMADSDPELSEPEESTEVTSPATNRSRKATRIARPLARLARPGGPPPTPPRLRVQGSTPPPTGKLERLDEAQALPQRPTTGSLRERGLPLAAPPPAEPVLVGGPAPVAAFTAHPPRRTARGTAAPAPADTRAVTPAVTPTNAPTVAPASPRTPSLVTGASRAADRRRALIVHTILPLSLLILTYLGFALAFVLAKGDTTGEPPGPAASASDAASAAAEAAATRPPSPPVMLEVSPIEEPAAADAKGIVRLTADAPTTIYNDHRPLGALPIELALDPGEYKFKALSDGGVKKYFRVVVKPGKNKRVHLAGMTGE